MASQGFAIFPWSRHFETGLADIDDQHRVLVSILNRLAWHFAFGSPETNSTHLLDELLDYASYHFRYEEGVWSRTLGQSEMCRNHHEAHELFFERIQVLRQSEAPEEEVLADLFDYLTRWLAFHILESDRRMALTVKAVEAGAALPQARDQVDTELSGPMSIMVTALLEIYGKLSASAIQLMHEKLARQRAEGEVARPKPFPQWTRSDRT